MQDKKNWNWDAGKEMLADVAAMRKEYADVHEFSVSADGTKIAAPVKLEDDTFTAVCNGQAWETSFEKLWYARFSPDNRLTALVMEDDAWTLAVDGQAWEEKFSYAWNPKFSADGAHAGMQVKQDFDYTLAVDGQAWETTFLATRDFAISPDGALGVALVQVEMCPKPISGSSTAAPGPWP